MSALAAGRWAEENREDTDVNEHLPPRAPPRRHRPAAAVPELLRRPASRDLRPPPLLEVPDLRHDDAAVLTRGALHLRPELADLLEPGGAPAGIGSGLAHRRTT